MSLTKLVVGGAAALAGALIGAKFISGTENAKPKHSVAGGGKRKVSTEFVSPGSPVVVLDYYDLIDDNADLSAPIKTAYGYDGLGLLVVKNVPKFVELRKRLLPLAAKFANLPPEVKAKYEHKESMFSFGWSHGKEQFEGKPDFAKGSYYNNPLYDRPFEDDKTIQEHITFAHPNIWPTKDLPDLQGAFKDLGKLMVDVGMLVAKHCDAYVEKHASGYEKEKLQRVIRTSRVTKARLLHYFPCDSAEASQQVPSTMASNTDDVDFGSWCGWHNDHGSLTGLCGAMYLDKNGKEVPSPDPKAGLYIRSRKNEVIRAAFPSDYLAFQMGEAHQIQSGGLLLATPHCVRAAMGDAAKGISRETYAVFMEPEWTEPLTVPNPLTSEDALRGTARQYLPRGVPLLEKRWKPGMNFGDFTEVTVSQYTIY